MAALVKTESGLGSALRLNHPNSNNLSGSISDGSPTKSVQT